MTSTAPGPAALSPCDCDRTHEPRRVVLTGGPGAGKTAVLEMIRATACRHVLVLPESASVVFGGGFPRKPGFGERRAAQRAIFHVQRELESLGEAQDVAIVLCDRGTIDGLAYWPGDPDDLWSAVHADPQDELHRYAAVIHLRSPGLAQGYNRANPLRTESAETAAQIDARIADVWAAHPKVVTIAASADFLTKADTALRALRSELPECCAQHVTVDHASHAEA